MKVLWISPGFAAHENDTTCIPPLQLLAMALKSMGIDLHIVTIAYPPSPEPYLWNSIEIKPAYGFNKAWFKWLNWIRAYRYGLRMNNKKKFDIIHSFWLGPAWLVGKYLSKKCLIPHVTTLMGQDVLKSNKYNYLLHSADMKNTVAVSQFQANELYKSKKLSPFAIIEWGLNQAELIFRSNGEKPIDIIGCGSLIKLKNWDLWIDTVSGIIDQYNKPIKAVMIGEGPEKHKLLSRIRSLGKQDNIKILDALPRNEVLNLMGQSRILLHTSSFESYGLVLVEAYAMGCQVVSTPVGIAEKFGQSGRTKEDLEKLIINAFKLKPSYPQSEVPKITETALQYLDLYKNKIKSFKSKPSF